MTEIWLYYQQIAEDTGQWLAIGQLVASSWLVGIQISHSLILDIGNVNFLFEVNIIRLEISLQLMSSQRLHSGQLVVSNWLVSIQLANSLILDIESINFSFEIIMMSLEMNGISLYYQQLAKKLASGQLVVSQWLVFVLRKL